MHAESGSLTVYIEFLNYENNDFERAQRWSNAQQIVNFKVHNLAQKRSKSLSRLYFTHPNNVWKFQIVREEGLVGATPPKKKILTIKSECTDKI